MPSSLPPLADRVASYRPSAVRAVFAKAAQPGVISLAGGSPHLSELDMATIADLTAEIIRERGEVALQYSFGVGLPRLRAQVAEILRDEGVAAEPADVMITIGSQQAIESVAKILLDPGDVVIVEGPSYAAGLSVFTSYQADVRAARTDDQGIDPADVERLLAEAAAQGRPAKLVYVTASYQNPANTVIPPERRRELVRVCGEHGALILEDSPYGLLGFDGGVFRAMKADAPDAVIYLGSFSKMFAPGLRLGWVVAPAPYQQALADTIETMVVAPPTLNQMIMCEYLDRVDWRAKLTEMRGVYQRRERLLSEALREHLPASVTWRRPLGSFYLWLTFPGPIDSEELCEAALERGVAFVPGTGFYLDGRGHSEARLSYCLPPEHDLPRAAEILGDLVRERLGES